VRDFRQILDAVIDGVLVVDDHGCIEFVNSEACRILDTSSEAALSARLEEIVGPDHAVAKVAQAVLGGGRSVIEDERRIPRRMGEDVIADVAASPLVDEGDGSLAVVIALRDRTIQRTLEEWVSEREQLSAFGQIAAGIAHEVKNPLGGIRGAAELLSRRSEASRDRDAAELIVREVDRITSLVDDLMVFTQSESVRRAPINIHRVLDEVLELLALDPLARGIALERSYDPSIPDLLGDGDRLIQVFLNLARNALQALAGEGTLRFETRITLDHRLTSVAGEPLPTISVLVEDDGPGIPQALIEKVMTPLFTTRAGGTGLGLAVSRHWVALHGGVLRIESHPDRGTRVRVALPVTRELEPTS
jgi:two-component system nitrogen regulation sensor histidine kinase GlnL